MSANNEAPTTVEKNKMIRLDIYVRKHPSLTTEEFHERWSNVHGKLVKNWLAEKGIYRYTQYHAPPELKTQALGIHDDADILDFDGHAEVVVPDLDTLRRLVEDDFFEAFAKPDEAALVDLTSVRRSIGYEEHHVEHGKAL
ncbi:hypothetical protein DM02DRAFT_605204 [Periconia macrospinosa]|uniref:EthD domain-containing protein n=1 Tax=Periconia macrospinosa TaxID=97972 RepID=A0A2V1D397_9PLEO|nr:hypothetical protein DM02DRAFT_605204 [Periconia macrospinosa]